MREKGKKRTTVAIAKETKDALDSVKRPGQSYDGVIRELILVYKEHPISRLSQQS